MGVIGVGLIVLVLLAVMPPISAAMRAHKSVAVIIVLLYLAILALHPYIFGLPGRINEWRFQHQIRPNMTRDEIVRLATKLGGTDLYGNPLDKHSGIYDWPYTGAIYVIFVDSATFCIVNGTQYNFYFSPNERLSLWRRESWGSAC